MRGRWSLFDRGLFLTDREDRQREVWIKGSDEDGSGRGWTRDGRWTGRFETTVDDEPEGLKDGPSSLGQKLFLFLSGVCFCFRIAWTVFLDDDALDERVEQLQG